MVILKIYEGLSIFLNIVSAAIVVYALMSWFVRPGSGIHIWMHRIMEPVLRPFRPISQRLMASGFMFDMTPWIAIIAIRLIQWLLTRMLLWFL